MDWIWRICLGFAAIWSVNETDIWMVADYRTDDGLIINSVISGLIATLGALPLCFKMFPGLLKGKEKSKPQTDSHLHSTKSQNSFRETDIWQKTLERQRSTETDEENRTPPKPQKRTSDKKVDATRPNRHKKPSVTSKRKTRKQSERANNTRTHRAMTGTACCESARI